MDKKTIITVILATVLALLFACVILNKKTNSEQINQQVSQQEKVVVLDEASVEEENLVEDNATNLNEESEKAKNSASIQPIKTNTVKSSTNKEPVFNKIVVQQGSVVEEVEQDYGIKKVGNTIEITREFKVNSPIKYSFKDFGILDKVTTK